MFLLIISSHFIPSVSQFPSLTACSHCRFSYLQAQPHNMSSAILLSQEMLGILTGVQSPIMNMRLLRCDQVTLAISQT